MLKRIALGAPHRNLRTLDKLGGADTYSGIPDKLAQKIQQSRRAKDLRQHERHWWRAVSFPTSTTTTQARATLWCSKGTPVPPSLCRAGSQRSEAAKSHGTKRVMKWMWVHDCKLM